MNAFKCLTNELTDQELEEFKNCFTMQDDDGRDAKFDELMKKLLNRLSITNKATQKITLS